MTEAVSQENLFLKKYLSCCRLCPRNCGVNRMKGEMCRCRSDFRIRVGLAALHFWEEPCISASEGSGAVFFSGCALGCRFCQNHSISGGAGETVTDSEGLSEIFLDLQAQGANNINLVTPDHYTPQIVLALERAKNRGLTVPVICNTGGYNSVETLRLFEGLVDVYLPDMKYMNPDTAAKMSAAPDYPSVAKAAIAEMVRQTGETVFDERGMVRRGVIIRLLLLPGHVREAKQIVEWAYRTFGDRVFLSLMSQYTPMERVKDDPLLGRKVTKREYSRLIDYAVSLGVTNAYIQEGDVAEESFIPAFHPGRKTELS